MKLWLLIAGMALITFGLRLSFIALAGRFEIPRVIQRALRFAPVAVLTAIVVPLLLNPGPGFTISPDLLRLFCAVVAFLIARQTRNILATVAGGMLLLWSLQALLPLLRQLLGQA
ncbi:AzlD domain-containing protein [Piscinibacter sakaiensis]|uniref:AzlD domain-containing protein n=1 Tax=Piscinibacter sakaiensis TaxID=1547922 RepID=UPI003AAC9A93